ncbi:divergent PAP2 family protein [Chloroflexota bacterium]
MISEVLLIPVCAWAVAQVIKVFVILIKEKRLDLRYFVSSGGMPSAHSATVCALATAVAIKDGMNSVTFSIAAILAIVVMYDAAGVRRAVSRQSIVLNRMLKEFREKRSRDEVEHDFRVLIGHTPFQVIVGAILGAAIAVLWLRIIGG